MRFEPTAKGLYAYSQDNNIPQGEAWVFLTTVKANREKYTRRAYSGALKARRLQNIIMFPGARQFESIIANNHLPNADVTREDIKAADDIFGANIGSLNGKTVSRPGHPVSGTSTPVPRDILQTHKRVTLSVDIMFVNSVPFLLTISRNIRFGTVETLPNRQMGTIKQALQRVFKHYARRGFRVQTTCADPEFQPLEGSLRETQFNFCAENEHVPDIERYVRTVKDRVRSGYNLLPFDRIPRQMLIRLLSTAVFWLNAFPHQDGVSSTSLPATS